MTGTPSYTSEDPFGNFTQGQIQLYLKKLRFRPRLFGVDQLDVWKKLEQLNGMYERAMLAQKLRYEALLSARPVSAESTVRQDCSPDEET